MSEQRFPNNNLLVSTGWLADHLDDADLCLVEVTNPGTGYRFGHIPGAVYLDPDQEIFTGRASGVPSTIGPLDEVAAALGQLGLSPAKRVVVYDEIGGTRAAQTFWLLEHLGFERVHLLEGGLERWMAEGRPQTSAVPQVAPANFEPIVRADRLATAEWILSHLEAGNVSIVDCRTSEEYLEGHIPGAKNRSWEETLQLQAYHSFQDAADLKAEFAGLGVPEDTEVVTYCNTGRRSAHTYLTLRLLGYSKVRNYDGSWTEWGEREDLPKG